MLKACTKLPDVLKYCSNMAMTGKSGAARGQERAGSWDGLHASEA